MRKKNLVLIMAVIVFCGFGFFNSLTVTYANSIETLQSKHPYDNNTNNTWTYTHPDSVLSLSVTFSEDTITENGCDYIYIYDEYHNCVGTYTGTELSGKTISVDGSVVKIRLVSDSSNSENGFRVVDITPVNITGPITDLSGYIIDRDSILFEFNKPIGAEKVTLEYSVDGENWNAAEVETVIDSSSENAIVSGLEMNIQYNFRLNVIGGYRNGYSNIVLKSIETTPESSFVVSNGKIKEYTGSEKEIIIPDTINGVEITELSDYAFANCKSILSVTIPDGVTEIKSYVFYNCNNLIKIDIPDSVIKIGASVFNGCTGLTEVTIGKGVTEIGASAFADCESIEKIEWNAKNVSDFNGNSYDNYYPFYNIGTNGEGIELIFGAEVERIPANAFYNCSKLAKADIPDSVITIGASAFYGCTGLTEVTIGKGVTEIGVSAFSNCKSIEKIEWNAKNVSDLSDYYSNSHPFYNIGANGEGIELIFGAEVERIPAYAFYNCSKLSKADIPDSVITIGSRAFSGCTGLTEVTIGKGVTEIGAYAFSNCSKLSKADIPDSVIAIGASAFNGCAGLTEVTIGKGVTEIGASAFSNCHSIEKIEWNAKNVSDFIDSYGNSPFYNIGTNGEGIELIFGAEVERIPAYAFSNCSRLTKIKISDSVKTIGESAFSNCNQISMVCADSTEGWCGIKFENMYSNPIYYSGNLYCNDEIVEEVIVGDKVETISAYAFINCQTLKSVCIGENVAFVGNKAFYECNNLERIEWNAKNVADFSEEDYVFRQCGSNTNGMEIRFGENVESIPAYMLSSGYNASNFKKIEFGNNITKIGAWAFAGYNDIEQITLPEKLLEIGDGAFYNWNSLQQLKITNVDNWCRITYYDSNMDLYRAEKEFYEGNKKISRITIQDDILSVSPYAFYECTDILTVTLGDGITSIGESAFSGCSSLLKITVPENLKTIGEQAFYCCSSLSSIYIPKTVQSIGSYAFSGCDRMTSVYISDLEAWCNIDFQGYNSNPITNRTKFYLDGEILTDVIFPENITEIKQNVFENYEYLKSVTIPGNVVSIGKDAFNGCNGIESVYIYNLENWCRMNFSSIYTNPLYYAEFLYVDGILLEDLIIPETVTKVGYAQFCGLDSLKSVLLHENVQTIEDYAFYNCRNIRWVAIPENISYIKNDAFFECPNISKVFFTGSEEAWKNDVLIYEDSSNLRNAELICEANVKTYNFVTNCETEIEPLISYGVSMAPAIENGDKKLYGWYDNPEFTGENVSFPYSGDATTLYALWTDKTGSDFGDAIAVKVNTKYSFEMETYETLYYEFTAQTSGEHIFKVNKIRNGDCCIYNSKEDMIAHDYSDNDEILIKYYCQAGEKYYIRIQNYDAGTASLLIEGDGYVGTKTVCITSVTGESVFTCIPSNLPEDSSVILACYRDGALAEVQSTPNENRTIHFVTKEDFENAKIMVWDSFTTLKPLCEVEVVTNNEFISE